MNDRNIRLKRIRYANVAGFLIYSKSDAVLVDCGHPGTVDVFLRKMKELEVPFDRIRLIVLTHTHFDHAGGSAEISRITGAPIAVHRSEVKYLEKGYAPFPSGTRWKGKLLAIIGRIFLQRMAHYPPATASVIIENEADLLPYGIPGNIVHTPGHTGGSLSVMLEDGNAIVGDNVLGISDKRHFPPFANDCKKVIESWAYYIESGAKLLHPAHGRAISVESLRSEIETATRRYT